MIKTAAIVAMAENRVIGNNNQLPWHLPEDLKHFKTVTMGKPIIMGRLTYESIGKPLLGRANIVVTRQNHLSYSGVETVNDLSEGIQRAKELASANNQSEVMVIGGANIYRQVLSMLDVLYITEVHQPVQGDALFPEIDLHNWREVSRTGPQKSEAGGLDYSFVIFHRR